MSDEYTGPIRFCPTAPAPFADDRAVLEKQPNLIMWSPDDSPQSYERFRCKVCGLVILILGIEEVQDGR